ncbi:hypothetical protein [Streptomyces sp. NPDC001404]|uniref:hypothetical protein n=1 Tax=Streptomyces sp. NPDC001404 TaxID=3364571 RepID=UPI0036BA4592
MPDSASTDTVMTSADIKRTSTDTPTEALLRTELAMAQARINTLEHVAQRNRDHIWEIIPLIEQAATGADRALAECDAMEHAMATGCAGISRLREHLARIRAALDDTPGA